MTVCQKLSDLAKAELEELKDAGIQATPEEVVTINYLAAMVESPTARRELSRGRPVILTGGVALWPRTISGALWWEWFDSESAGGDRLKTLAMAYSMAHGRDIPTECYDIKIATDTVRVWSRQLRVTPAELDCAISEMLEQEDDGVEQPPTDSDEDTSTTLQELAAVMVATAGGSPEMWERQVSIRYVCDMLTTITAQNQVENRPSDADPKIRAEKALGYAIMRVRDRHAQEQDANG
jgi:hypothetical protein